MADYERLKRLGGGNFGDVWLVYDRALGVQWAVKYIPSSRISDPTDFYKEPQTLMDLRHDNIVAVQDAGKMSDGTLYVAMEHVPRGSIADIFKGAPVSLSRAMQVLEDVCWAVEYAHQRGYIHRDIKPGNILIAKGGTAKLSDFGLATKVPRGGTASAYGYITHVAPEVLTTGKTSKLSDVYALGVTAYRLINGDGFLPEVSDVSDIQDMILVGEYPNRGHYRPYIPLSVQKIVNKCMAIRGEDRFQSASESRRELEKVQVYCDWRLRRKRHTAIYTTKMGDAKLKVVVISLDNGRFDITTSKKVRGGQERRVKADSSSDLTLSQMRRRLRQILPRYVSQGR